MKVKAAAGNPGIATVYLAEMANGKYIEFVESVQPPIPKEEKWVLIVSTLYGCPVGCSICDAGGWYDGPLSTEDILAQVDYLVTRSFPDREIPTQKFKIQFARMGEPALNPNVLQALDALPTRFRAPGLIPSLSTIAPSSTGRFFETLLDIKQNRYSNGKFQLQFSLHSTDSEQRNRWIPVKKWSFEQIARFAERFYQPGDRKVTLNFALAEDTALDPDVLLEHFDPQRFVIKLTPVNPTIRATGSGIVNAVTGDRPGSEPPAAAALRQKGYDVIVSIGHLEENKIGSNCGQYVRRFMENNQQAPPDSYRYQPIVL